MDKWWFLQPNSLEGFILEWVQSILCLMFIMMTYGNEYVQEYKGEDSMERFLL